uniref:THD domain-containing protein n=1 Tax=Hucho hucho TaxID=62062 RepID=A0A4W5N8Y1_9TELE
VSSCGEVANVPHSVRCACLSTSVLCCTLAKLIASLVSPPAPYSFNHSKMVYLEWEYNLGLAHLSGFKYHDGNLIVLKDGMYKVYLQITFRSPGHFVCSEEDSGFILTQKVILLAKSYHKNRDLLTASDTVDCIPKSNDCQPPGSEGCKEDSGTQYWEKSLCTSGVFKLKAGDRLRVRKGDRALEEGNQFYYALIRCP